MNDQLISEIRALREEVMAMRAAMEAAARRTAMQFARFEVDGGALQNKTSLPLRVIGLTESASAASEEASKRASSAVRPGSAD